MWEANAITTNAVTTTTTSPTPVVLTLRPRALTSWRQFSQVSWLIRVNFHSPPLSPLTLPSMEEDLRTRNKQNTKNHLHENESQVDVYWILTSNLLGSSAEIGTIFQHPKLQSQIPSNCPFSQGREADDGLSVPHKAGIVDPLSIGSPVVGDAAHLSSSYDEYTSMWTNASAV